MKNHLTLAVALLFAASLAAFAAPDEAALKTKETAAWQAYKDKKGDDFQKVVGTNMIGVYSDGFQDMQAELSGMQKWNMKSFTISDYKVKTANDNTAVSTYTVKVEGSVDGKDASGTYNAGSVWQQEGGEWKAIFHANVMQLKK